ncbi:Macrolide-specific efflux protein MacA [Labilithrix luteola]|uniref:Macrolide-specific efflux protein MacA n=1 Tax=Labilithrix luteola TaxID=1391654 RepID=A0A0K1PSS6_9BACT|nr:efflux RND transporter periplasmic adaptor subunit [Labilithrix luteola]AKU96595.1 Macrolide-specific efflux protein MacA [Labilithrix luteola]
MKSEIATDDVARTLGVGAHGARSRWLRRSKWWLIAGGVVVMGVVAVRFVAARAGRRDVPRYLTAHATRGDLRVTVSATGTLAALGAVEVGSEVSGRVQNVYVDYNQKVTKGQVLAEIDPVQLKAEATQAGAQLAANQAAIQTAMATLTETTQSLKRAEAQATDGLVAAKDVEAARAAFSRAEASVASAKAQASLASATVSSSAWKLTKAKIVSPIDGVVLSRSVEPGQTVAATFQTPILFKLSTDLGALELNVQIDESDVGRVREGLEADFRVDAYPDRVFKSRVRAVRNEAKTSSNVVYYEAILTVDNADHLLRPGMTATATITSELHSNVLLVPNVALRFEPPTKSGPPGPPGAGAAAAPASAPLAKGKKRLYTLGPDGRTLAPLEVTPGATDGTNTELTEAPIKEGTTVVTDVEEVVP